MTEECGVSDRAGRSAHLQQLPLVSVASRTQLLGLCHRRCHLPALAQGPINPKMLDVAFEGSSTHGRLRVQAKHAGALKRSSRRVQQILRRNGSASEHLCACAHVECGAHGSLKLANLSSAAFSAALRRQLAWRKL